ncbi:hypothetical protein [Trinickia dinghuensis]|uniref:Uncharacterized protein n=1 Tax=Trinickia dinghuensis TaxID=2291023 RepID=A0A3D8K2D7_9BURK|nr:hypothetical protein [Trinickia dinghuensis]RDU98731.1 hypothetical protein DWV00_10710 [Trinickia dinghuensis]
MTQVDDDGFGMLGVPLSSGARHLDEVGRAKHGVLIEIAGLPQAEVNHLQRAIAVVLEAGSDAQRAEANALLQHLASRGEIVAGAWGSANPSDFTRALAEAAEAADRAAAATAALVLLYRPARFGGAVKQWIEAAYRSLPLDTWKDIYARMTARTAR